MALHNFITRKGQAAVREAHNKLIKAHWLTIKVLPNNLWSYASVHREPIIKRIEMNLHRLKGPAYTLAGLIKDENDA